MSHLFNDPMRDLIEGNFEVDHEYETRDLVDNPMEIKTKIEPKKRSVRNPRPRLTVDILTGSRGLHVLENYFVGVNFQGKHKEKEDLDEIMRRMQHWAHRMYPNMTFDDVIETIEKLNNNKTLKMHMDRYRSGDLQQDDLAVKRAKSQAEHEEPFDEFDALIDEQLAMSKTRNNTSTSDALGKEVGLRNDSLHRPSKLTAEQKAAIQTNKRKALLKLQAKRSF